MCAGLPKRADVFSPAALRNTRHPAPAKIQIHSWQVPGLASPELSQQNCADAAGAAPSHDDNTNTACRGAASVRGYQQAFGASAEVQSESHPADDSAMLQNFLAKQHDASAAALKCNSSADAGANATAATTSVASHSYQHDASNTTMMRGSCGGAIDNPATAQVVSMQQQMPTSVLSGGLQDRRLSNVHAWGKDIAPGLHMPAELQRMIPQTSLPFGLSNDKSPRTKGGQSTGAGHSDPSAAMIAGANAPITAQHTIPHSPLCTQPHLAGQQAKSYHLGAPMQSQQAYNHCHRSAAPLAQAGPLAGLHAGLLHADMLGSSAPGLGNGPSVHATVLDPPLVNRAPIGAAGASVARDITKQPQQGSELHTVPTAQGQVHDCAPALGLRAEFLALGSGGHESDRQSAFGQVQPAHHRAAEKCGSMQARGASRQPSSGADSGAGAAPQQAQLERHDPYAAGTSGSGSRGPSTSDHQSGATEADVPEDDMQHTGIDIPRLRQKLDLHSTYMFPENLVSWHEDAERGWCAPACTACIAT